VKEKKVVWNKTLADLSSCSVTSRAVDGNSAHLGGATIVNTNKMDARAAKLCKPAVHENNTSQAVEKQAAVCR